MRALSWLILTLSPGLAVPGFANQIPRPEEVLGFPVGADHHLPTYEQALAYFEKLAGASPRVRLEEFGKSSSGRPMFHAVISSPENLARLDRFKQIARQLALVGDLTDERARALSREGKAIVWIDGGLHASEVAPASVNIELAYELARAEDPATRRILDDVILLLVYPNPDGMTLIADWYRENVGTPYEVSPAPFLYQRYVGHDNNRDSYMLNMRETRNLTRLVHKVWFPLVFYNQHQTGPFPARIFIPPESEPTNPNVHPLVLRWRNLFGSAMGAAFDAAGKEGVISRIVYDSWYPGYVTQVVDSHNVVALLTETALYRYATPRFYTVEDFPAAFKQFTVSAFYPNPWRGGWWRIRDAVDYNLIAARAVLDTASRYREELLFNRYLMGRQTREKFRREPPFGWVIPAAQKDPWATWSLLERLQALGIDVYRARESLAVDGVSYPAGSHILPGAQPFGHFLKTLLEIQHYPDLRKVPALWQGVVRPEPMESAPPASYDVTGWTLPLQMGVEAVELRNPLAVKGEPLAEIPSPEGKIEGSGNIFLVSHAANRSFVLMTRAIAAGARVKWTKKSANAGGSEWPAGTMVFSGIARAGFEPLVRLAGIDAVAVATEPAVEAMTIRLPRVGLYHSWVANIDEGWTEWLLEQHEIPFRLVANEELRAGGLRQRYDVLIFPDATTRQIAEGHAPGTVPPRYTGGLGEEGVRALQEFVEAGGTLIAMDSASQFAIEKLRLPVDNVTQELKPAELSAPGTLLAMNFEADHPLAYGMPQEGVGFFSSSPAFEVRADSGKATVVARYPKKNLLRSGFLHGEEKIAGKASVVEVKRGSGRVVLLGFRTQHRGQPHLTFKLLFNAIYTS